MNQERRKAGKERRAVGAKQPRAQFPPEKNLRKSAQAADKKSAAIHCLSVLSYQLLWQEKKGLGPRLHARNRLHSLNDLSGAGSPLIPTSAAGGLAFAGCAFVFPISSICWPQAFQMGRFSGIIPILKPRIFAPASNMPPCNPVTRSCSRREVCY